MSNIREAIGCRRSHYALSPDCPISDEEVGFIINTAILNVPSAFNSQSTRLVLLLGESHKKLWDIVKETLRKIVPPDRFVNTETKINMSFLAAHGTILFYEDQSAVKNLMDQFPLYKDNFPIWSMQTNGMHQFAIWTMLCDAGCGVNIQHYNPLIDEEVAKTFNIDPNWKLVCQMPFGKSLMEPGEKSYEPLDERVKIFE